MKHKLISVALITVLLLTVLVNVIGCDTTPPATQYDLTITSTAGGDVTAPTEGTHTYDAGMVVNLTATADVDYHFVKWTGNVGTIADDEDATTTITMNGNYTITANFGFDMVFIDEVSDANQPPTNTLQVPLITNFCAPMAMVNIALYWDVVMGHSNAYNVTAGLIDKTAAEYIGWFMDTNNQGSGARANAGQLGTLDVDIMPGAWEFIRWDAVNQFLVPPPPPPPLPTGKLGYDWTITPDYGAVGFNFYKTEIDAGRPPIVCFNYWHPESTQISVTDPATGETVDVFYWGEYQGGSHEPDPDEYWSGEVGHAVTGVGYKLNWDPDGAGPLGSANYVIVHDNWATTPENVAIPWLNWKSSHAVDPGADE